MIADALKFSAFAPIQPIEPLKPKGDSALAHITCTHTQGLRFMRFGVRVIVEDGTGIIATLSLAAHADDHAFIELVTDWVAKHMKGETCSD